MNAVIPLQSQLNRIQRVSLRVGLVGLVVCIVGAWFSLEQFFESWLVAFIFWLGVALGCTAYMMVHHLVGGRWGGPVRPLFESASQTLPLMAALFVPLLFGLSDLYVWARPAAAAAQELLAHKRAYLNEPFFVLRAILYFAVWIVLAYLLTRGRNSADPRSFAGTSRRLLHISAGGLILYFLTGTFAGIDWIMSLEIQWYSTGFGFLYLVGQALSGLAFTIVLATVLSEHPPLHEVATPSNFLDLGNLLLTSVMLWTYLSFMQFLIIWNGNMVDEIPFYVHRSRGGWQWMAAALAVFHFALPFALLLFRRLKRGLPTLGAIAGSLFLAHLIDAYWLVIPSLHPGDLRVHWLDVVAPVTVGGIWLAVFAWRLGRRLEPPDTLAGREGASG